MRKIIITATVIFLSSISIFAQDIITFHNSDKVEVGWYRFSIETALNMPIIRSEGTGWSTITRYDDWNRTRGNEFHFNAGIRATKNYTPHFSWDIAKLKFMLSRIENNYTSSSSSDPTLSLRLIDTITSFQFLSGLRFSSPYFGKKKRTVVEFSFRLGLGMWWTQYCHHWHDSSNHNSGNDRNNSWWFGFPSEWDITINFNGFFAGMDFGMMPPSIYHHDLTILNRIYDTPRHRILLVGLKVGYDFKKK